MSSWRKLLSPATAAPLRELRIHLCQSSAGSKGLRDFVRNQYEPLKKELPNLPVLVRESSGVEARIFARFDKGVEKKVVVEGLGEKDIQDRLVKALQQ